MKIAVCLHGQSRTWKKCVSNIKKFFDLGPEHEIFYFGHTWGMNSWKRWTPEAPGAYFEEDLDTDELYKNICEAFGPNFYLTVDKKYQLPENIVSSLEIQKDPTSGFENATNQKIPHTWNSMLYSHMIANHNKQRYEIENKILFDIVVSIRFDQCFDPNLNFATYLPSRPFRKDWLYTEIVDFPFEFHQQALSDTFYYGSSKIMDQMDSFYRIYHNGKFFQLLNVNYFDGALKTVGCGVLLYKWATIKNIHLENIGHIAFQVVREDSKIQDGITDYTMLIDEARTWGIPILK